MDGAVRAELDVKSFRQNVLCSEFIICCFQPRDVCCSNCGGLCALWLHGCDAAPNVLKQVSMFTHTTCSPLMFDFDFFFFFAYSLFFLTDLFGLIKLTTFCDLKYYLLILFLESCVPHNLSSIVVIFNASAYFQTSYIKQRYRTSLCYQQLLPPFIHHFSPHHSHSCFVCSCARMSAS